MIRIEHIRRAGYCNKGARIFAKRHGINWADFVRNGIEPERLAQTGDAMALRLIEVARGK